MALLLASDVPQHEIALSFHCHKATVCRVQQNIDQFGQASSPALVPMGRPRKISVEALEGLLDWLLENGDDKKLSYLDEMVHFLDDEYDITTSRQTVSRVLKANNITQKAVSIQLLLCGFETHSVD